MLGQSYRWSGIVELSKELGGNGMLRTRSVEQCSLLLKRDVSHPAGLLCLYFCPYTGAKHEQDLRANTELGYVRKHACARTKSFLLCGTVQCLTVAMEALNSPGISYLIYNVHLCDKRLTL